MINEFSGAGSFSARPSPDKLSLSVIGTISITIVGYNSTFRSYGHVYQGNKQAVKSLPARTIRCISGDDCGEVTD